MVSGTLPRKHDGQTKPQKLAGLLMAAPRHRDTHGPSARSLVRKLHEPVLCHLIQYTLEHCTCACAEDMHEVIMICVSQMAPDWAQRRRWTAM